MAEATLVADQSVGDPGTPGKRRRRARLAVTVVAVVVLLSAVLADRTVLAKHHKPTAPVTGALVTLPKTTLNLSGGSLLQVEVAIQLQAGVGTPRGLPPGEMARLENREINVLSQFSKPTLSSPTGKDRSRASLLSSFRRAVGPGKVGPGVLAVYYVDFIMQ